MKRKRSPFPFYGLKESCTSKRAYPNEDLALAERKRIGGDTGDNSQLRSYRCIWCRMWHLGGNPQRRLRVGRIKPLPKIAPHPLEPIRPPSNNSDATYCAKPHSMD